VPVFEMQFPREEVEALASRFSYTDDEACQEAGRAARARGYYERDEFLRVCAWKTPRSGPKVAANTAAAIAEATGRALASEDEATRMEALLELPGVGAPTASTLLHFAFPDEYPILDVRALESLGVKARTQYPVSFWLAYMAACRELAKRCRVHIRTLDKALWQYSKERPQTPVVEAGVPLILRVSSQLPPLKNEAKSLLSPDHKQAPRVRALLEAAAEAKLPDEFPGFGRQRIGMELVVSPPGAAVGEATNALGGIGDVLQARRVNLNLTYLGELADAFLFDDDAQIREATYREEPGELGYRITFWALND
jgi:hypothetical protein